MTNLFPISKVNSAGQRSYLSQSLHSSSRRVARSVSAALRSFMKSREPEQNAKTQNDQES